MSSAAGGDPETGAPRQQQQQQQQQAAGDAGASAGADPSRLVTDDPDDEEEDADKLLLYGSKQIIRLFVPVSVCMLFVVSIISTVSYYSTTQVYLPYTPFHDKTDDPGKIVWQSLLNALIILCLVIVMTIVLILLYKFRCYKVIQGWLYVTSALILFFFSMIFFAVILSTLNMAFDYITMAVCIWNFGLVGQVAVHWKGPLLLQQLYLIFISALMALVFIKFLPEWTTWVLLVLISIWDLVAVLCPKGPLRMLVETAQERNESLFPSLIYSTTAVYLAVGTATADQQNQQQEGGAAAAELDESASHEQQHQAAAQVLNGGGGGGGGGGSGSGGGNESPGRGSGGEGGNAGHEDSSGLRVRNKAFQDESHGVKLGLGDFVFYSILVGRASSRGDWNTTLSCYFAILIGLSLTLLLLAIGRRALPALPISITFGVIFYFLTSIIVTPFVDSLTARQLFI